MSNGKIYADGKKFHPLGAKVTETKGLMTHVSDAFIKGAHPRVH
jgi:hypothetical protein